MIREGYPDHTAFDRKDAHYDPKSSAEKPIWYMVDVKLKRKFKDMISLKDLKNYAPSKLSDFRLLRKGNRLSVMPVAKAEWDFILSLQK